MSRVLVTGIVGQDGWYLSERLRADGHEVHGLTRRNERDEPDFVKAHPDVMIHYGDLADAASMRRVVDEVRPERVVNLGGISSVSYSWDYPFDTGVVSGLGAVALMEAARDLGNVRFLQASSAEIFGEATESPQDENTPIRPTSPYGAAKAYAHSMASVMRSIGLHASTCILYNHESPRRPETFVTRKITMAAARISRGLQDTLELGNLDTEKDWGWAPDYVDAMAKVLDHPEPDDFVIGTGIGHSVADFVEAAFTAAEVGDWRRYVTVNPAFVRPVDPTQMLGNASKAAEVLGWRPTVTFTDMVARMVEHDLALIDGSGGSGNDET